MTEAGDAPLVSKERDQKFPIGPIMLILAIELCERCCYYTIAGSMRNYVLLPAVGWKLSTASALTSTFGCVGWGCCLPGGIISDKIGLYPTILAACIIYVTGTSLVTIASIPPIGPSFKTLVFLLGTNVIVCMGMGGIKPNIMNFGAGQITRTDETGDRQRASFFSWFYVAINIGVFIAYLWLVTVATSGMGSAIPKKWGFFGAYLIATGAMAFAGFMYICGTKIYVRKKPTPSDENEIMAVFRTISYSASQGVTQAKVSIIGWVMMPLFVLISLTVAFVPGVTAQILTYVSLALGIISCLMVGLVHMDNSWLKERPVQGAFSVLDVQGTLRCIPLMLLINIGFNLCYNSMNAAFPAQACQMNTFISSKTQLNGAFFNVGDAFGIVIFAPLFESCIFPTWAKIQGKSVSLGQKLMVGLAIVAVANLVAAGFEVARKNAPLMVDRGYSDCAPPETYMNNISAFYMFIPFLLIGIAEIFVMPSMYYYTFSSAPVKVRATLQAFNLVAQGSVSNAFTSGLQLAFLPDDLNTGNLNIYYYVNAAVAFLAMGVYVLYRQKMGSSRDFTKPLTLDTPGDKVSSSLVGSFAKNPVLT